MRRGSGFDTRAFAALGALISGLGLPVTGIANHVYGFSVLSGTRHAWMAGHNVLGVLFVTFAVWHAVLNRRALWNHIRGSAERLPRFSREAALAGLTVAALVVLVVGHAFHA